jgi:hypothetical protein
VSRKLSLRAIEQRLRETADVISARLPSEWYAAVDATSATGGKLRVKASDGTSAVVDVIVSDRCSPRDAVALTRADAPALVSASWLSPRTREILDDADVGYIDTTGNASLRLSEPGLFIRTEGARRDPSPKPATGPNIRGPRAWALLRTMAEVQPPYRVTDLAAALDADAGYLSRLLNALVDELLVERAPRQPVVGVEWEGLLRQLTESYQILEANDATTWTASSGPELFLRDLPSTGVEPWAVTGSFAASQLVSVAAPEQAFVFTSDPEGLAESAGLRPARRGANVVLLDPYDPIVFDRTWSREGMVYASPAQIAVDCLGGPGRMPAEGEALLEWMRSSAPEWQAPSLTEEPALP